jgi:hypothetical protein
VALFPAESAADMVTNVSPRTKLGPSGELTLSDSPQLSVAVTGKKTGAVWLPAMGLTAVIPAGQISVGLCESVVITVKLQEADTATDLLWCADAITTTEPTGNGASRDRERVTSQSPESKDGVGDIQIALQRSGDVSISIGPIGHEMGHLEATKADAVHSKPLVELIRNSRDPPSD